MVRRPPLPPGGLRRNSGKHTGGAAVAGAYLYQRRQILQSLHIIKKQYNKTAALCGGFAFLYAFYYGVYAVANDKSQAVEYKVVNVGNPVVKGQLKYLYAQGKQHARTNGLGGGIKLFVYRGPYNTYGDEHGGVADYVQLYFKQFFIIRNVHEGGKVYPEGDNVCGVQNKGLDFAVELFKGEEGEAGNHNKANINKEQLKLPL